MPFRFTTAGESHGPGLTAVLEGIPAGLELTPEDIDRDLARRQLGHGRGGRMKIEKDRAEVTSGVRHGRTLGGPIALRMQNRDYANWEERMNPWPVNGDVDEVHLPRPGHADLAGVQKFGFTDVRNVLERASARETTSRGRGRRGGQGATCRALGRGDPQPGTAHRLCRRTGAGRSDRRGLRGRRRVAGALPRSRPHPRQMVAEINTARKANESLGGIYEVVAFGLVPGIGSHLSWDSRLDGRLAQAIMSIQAMKGVGIGDGLRPRRARGIGGPRRDLLLRGGRLSP